MNTNR